MGYSPCCKIIENRSRVTYSYNNTETILTKSELSNTTLIKVCSYNSYNSCIENIIDINKLCGSKYLEDNIDVRSCIYIKRISIKNDNRSLIVDFELSIFIRNKEISECCYEYCKNHRYIIPIAKSKVDYVSLNIEKVNFDILPNGKIKVCTFIKFKF